MRANEFLNEAETLSLKASGPSPAKEFIDKIYATYPKNPLNPNEVVLYHTQDEIAMFDLKPSVLGNNAVHISFMRAHPLRKGVGTLGMRKLQELAAKDRISLDLTVWQQGKVSAAALNKFYKKMGFKMGKRGLLVWTPSSIIDEVNIDNAKGKGAFPINQDVDYFGVRVLMKPSMFLWLALWIKEPKESLPFLKDYIKQGGAIGSPFLSFDVPKGWEEGDFTEFAKVNGHEGRHRMMAVQELEGDKPIEVHLFPTYRRSTDITDEWLKKLNLGMWRESALPQYKIGFVEGPLFTVLR